MFGIFGIMEAPRESRTSEVNSGDFFTFHNKTCFGKSADRVSKDLPKHAYTIRAYWDELGQRYRQYTLEFS